MLPSSPPSKNFVGSITFPFENLPVWTDRGEERRFGIATFAYDGRNNYWPTALTLEAKTFGALPRSIAYGAGPWREVFRRLEHYNAGDIQARIAEDLERRGGHMALSDEHLPAQPTERLTPPYVSPEVRQASMLIGAARTCVDAAAAVAVVAAVGAACLASQIDRPGYHHHAAIVATLEAGADR